jgi:hypothetical protein
MPYRRVTAEGTSVVNDLRDWGAGKSGEPAGPNNAMAVLRCDGRVSGRRRPWSRGERDTVGVGADELSGYWRALGMLRLDRSEGLLRLEKCFATGTVPTGLDGPLRGRLLATTVGRGVDGLFETAGRLWMPWLGKTFNSTGGDGRNLFTAGVHRILRLTLPGYHDVRPEGDQRCSAFRFSTSIGPSATDPGVEVLRIDYRAVPENRSWPVRAVLDELVAVDDGLYLGQALLQWRGSLRRAGWFSLERRK